MATSVESAGIDVITTIITTVVTTRGKIKREISSLCLKGTSVTTVDASSERSKN
jgi:hypothetical protein